MPFGNLFSFYGLINDVIQAVSCCNALTFITFAFLKVAQKVRKINFYYFLSLKKYYI